MGLLEGFRGGVCLFFNDDFAWLLNFVHIPIRRVFFYLLSLVITLLFNGYSGVLFFFFSLYMRWDMFTLGR